ncbi:MAG: Cof-type HAD-IIB family hydrolase [Tissierellia bacterium]|nr:Cof-type HAD-IIB family hydrolase [Tissierellia bacterium]
MMNENKYKDIKIIFFDVDGTLIDVNKEKISEKTLFALKKLKQKGIKICIATGRSPIMIPKFKDLEFDIFLTFNGSYCFNDREDIYRNPLEKEDVKKILDNAKIINRPVSIATNKEIVANGTEETLEKYFSFAKAKVNVSDKFDQILKDKDIFQVMMACDIEQREHVLKDTLESEITAWWDYAVDIIPKDGGKGKSVNAILDYYGFSKNQSMAFGDGENDITMLEAVGHGIAMGNAKEKIKNIADDICKSVDEDGIYYYLKDKRII